MTDNAFDSDLPPCGLYKTTEPLPGKEQWVREELLVYFHNHSEQGPPLLLLPSSNEDNRWTFHDKGYLIREPEYVETLIELEDEGFFILTEPLYLSDDEFIPENTLVELGYNRAAEPILFMGTFEDNAIVFPESGLKCTREVFEMLEPAPFRVPNAPTSHHD
ncbi:MAG: hypothetical protein ABEL76_04820 [Bradymonadaceae bacterium]